MIAFTEEQEDLRAVVRRFLADRADVRARLDSGEGHDLAVWRQLADQLGLPGIAVPEEYGGSGGGPVELGIVLEEMGRVLLPSPFFATVALVGQALTASGDDAAKSRWLPGIADGSLTATLAVAEESGRATDLTTTATGGTLSGTKMFVVDGHTADLLLVVARTGLFAVEGTAPGVTRTRLETLDRTRRLARIDFDGAPAVPIGESPPRKALDLAVVALAAEQVGGAQACLDMAVGHAKVRVQFDRPIGTFQAIKHKCADMLLAIEAARSAVYHAASAGDELPVAASVAGAYCSVAFTHAAKENIQIHGGVGYTWEHDAHRYLKRAKSSEQLFGAPAAHRARLADLVGI
ncbi:acyl-CoA dehydrogenase [Amycolatopsis mediterranei S699]|uniref:Acyl-CoA dehydrogenase n=2 Tax=Amycolatopsis mediterranei TaxID=33910 RepID=A0A0H3DFL1_AMYMU|nr:acyl-CoA dehydrogenase family protein [Amycolatopsis mediterranei]ADJ48883.1 acyl-CoA dehydrogenase [Amycolatopsis mediterranei U32]AEK45831.1 acyl-CoA dehydrogenase [Amycolatopsis mediterranei S699]AFO80591.1 acyl-CoA dehydrogenase [Amycolatopsis mediterranei S699]AGT87719.1 acyl-CoA dehydrogenase [Amycolatopsis mediterranei RB]KDU94000.1 acyl-CoA dehydrogenase [Amycolatopsis mediterranei]